MTDQTDEAPYTIIPFGVGAVGLGMTLVPRYEGEGDKVVGQMPAIVIFPPHKMGEPGAPYDRQMDEWPKGSIIMPFATDEAAHRLIGLILASLRQVPSVEPEEAAND